MRTSRTSYPMPVKPASIRCRFPSRTEAESISSPMRRIDIILFQYTPRPGIRTIRGADEGRTGNGDTGISTAGNVDCRIVPSYLDPMEFQQVIRDSETLIRTGEYDEAIRSLTEILAEEPENLPALLTVGIAYTESGRNEEALRALRYYLEREKENDLAWEAIGCTYLRMDRRAEAEVALETARELNPANAAVLRNLSILMGRLGRHGKAYNLLRESYELDSQDRLTMYAMACAYRQSGKPEKAAPLFESLRKNEHLPDDLRRDAAMQSIELTLGWF
ncbi:MAG: hypothetical protein EA427_08730 [Spirochaetaceae bacterium]|nr:MAG: hypothetical protein EA427_08730 [Spirochaetaceae bacterium]